MAFRWTTGRTARHGKRVSILAALLFGLFAGAPGWAATIERIDVTPGHVTIRLDGATDAAQSVLLDTPERIAIDIAGATPGGSWDGDGAISGVRQARHGDGTRVVLDLAAPVVVASGRWADDRRSLTLELKPVDDAAFATASDAAPLSWLPAGYQSNYKVTQDIPTRIAPPIRPRVYGDASLPLVVIDAGHGGHDPGSLSPDGSLREKDLTLKIALAVRDALVASGRVRAALTRDGDRFIELRERFGIARRMHADLFISIHCDSAPGSDATGATAYTLSEVSSDKEAARLAARENKSDLISGVDLDSNVDVSNILIDLTQRETINASAGFARLLGREAAPLIPTKANFHRTASLMVLKAADMPSILFETGYISSDQDAALLASNAGRAKIAESVKRAVDVYFARRLAMR